MKWPFVLRSTHERVLAQVLRDHHNVARVHRHCGTKMQAYHWGRHCEACK